MPSTEFNEDYYNRVRRAVTRHGLGGTPLDSRLLVDVVRMRTSRPITDMGILQQYEALIWARNSWLRPCKEHGYHFKGDSSVTCQGCLRETTTSSQSQGQWP